MYDRKHRSSILKLVWKSHQVLKFSNSRTFPEFWIKCWNSQTFPWFFGQISNSLTFPGCVATLSLFWPKPYNFIVQPYNHSLRVKAVFYTAKLYYLPAMTMDKKEFCVAIKHYFLMKKKILINNIAPLTTMLKK